MRNTQPARKPIVRRTVLVLATMAVAVSMTACSHAMMMMHGTGAKRPAASEFGLGPRASARGRYVATLEPARPLRPRQMQTVRVTVRDAEGRAIDEAQISIDGGMPQHGHGLPTRPRVTRNLGDGLYEIEGVRFNMGGWWEFTLAIAGSRGADTITFNLDL
ncbi:MAG TPA: FixH family protein [Vicinamibacterales bacterium]|nr:FixH family protein [Vicinamibacterales bacterium]